MKRRFIALLSTLLAISGSSSLLAQGTVVFQNSTNSVVLSWKSAVDQTLVGFEGFAQLFYAPSGTLFLPFVFQEPSTWFARNPDWQFGPITPVASGLFNAGTIELAGIPEGTAVDYVVIAWDAATFEDAYDDGWFWGVSRKYTIPTGGTGLQTPSLSSSFGPLIIPPVIAPTRTPILNIQVAGERLRIALRGHFTTTYVLHTRNAGGDWTDGPTITTNEDGEGAWDLPLPQTKEPVFYRAFTRFF